MHKELYKLGRSYHGGDDSQAMAQNFLLIFQKYSSLIGKNRKPPKVVYIPAIRDLFDNTPNPFLGGEKIIEKLEKLRDPASSDEKSPKLFSRIESFVQDVLEEPETHIVVPNERDTIQLLRNDGKRYELSQLGTGIHEIIYLAIVTTLFPDSFICIDEPELHMHPRLQRRLMQYLNTNTECQYLISTHSAHLIDSGIDASVFKVWMEKDHTTHLAYAGSNADKLEICNLLGYKASDLLQSNCVIWVEGPSDRLYLNYWIHGKASDLIEGVHYSIMFYGGRLLSHLSGDDDKDEKNPINLLRINRHSWILIDSDKEREDDTINGTKQRIQEEFKDHCWVTEGREIENYLPKADFEAALR
jgi:predicted ATP-dependent endonuclease of OLD family